MEKVYKENGLAPPCRNCEAPLCRQVCPADAVYKDPLTGIVEHNEDRCVGCNMCVMVCPFGAAKHTGHNKPACRNNLYTDNAKEQRTKRRTIAFRMTLSVYKQ
jgi:Fe-S-cluster-containing dehydrogenase component